MDSKDWIALWPTDSNASLLGEIRVTEIHFEQETPRGLRFHVVLLDFDSPPISSQQPADQLRQRLLRLVVGREEEEIVEVDWNASEHPNGEFE